VLVVVVDTSTPAVTAAVVSVEATVSVLAQRVTVDARAHGELLAPAIAACLSEARASVREVGAIVAGLGPGPFTGLRVGLVTAVAMAQARAVPVYGVCSLDGIGGATTGRVLVATDARRKEIYWARYDNGVRVGEPAVDRPASVVFDDLVCAGDGAWLYAEVLGHPVLDEPRYPRASVLAALAADRIRAGAPSEAMTPLYLRRPDAVEPGAPKPVRT
jgi:tRNA threonylcarbamoyl adenosine modification protein YeaZ